LYFSFEILIPEIFFIKTQVFWFQKSWCYFLPKMSVKSNSELECCHKLFCTCRNMVTWNCWKFAYPMRKVYCHWQQAIAETYISGVQWLFIASWLTPKIPSIFTNFSKKKMTNFSGYASSIEEYNRIPVRENFFRPVA